jgi:signal transduction histidine kinase/ligand-binding sensor domain-containing protein
LVFIKNRFEKKQITVKILLVLSSFRNVKKRATKNQIIFLCFSLAVWFIFVQNAQAQKLPFKNYTTAEGLAHDRVNRIVRDSHGFLWFCTGEGLARFDGYEFKNYTQAQGLPHRSISDLLELDDGTYLAATDDGLAVFNPKGAANPKPETENQKATEPLMFRTFRIPSVTSDNRAIFISDLYKARDGQIWAATAVGAYRLLREAEEWRFEKLGGEAWSDKIVEVSSVIEDRFDRVWFGTGVGLFIYTPASGETAYFADYVVGLSMVEDNQGHIWAGGVVNKRPGLFLFDVPDASGAPVLLRHFTTADGLTDNVWFNSILKTSDGRILIGIANGLCEFLPEARAGEPAFRVLFTTDIISTAEDSGGNLWLGTATRGAFKLTQRGFLFYQIKEQPPYGGLTSIFAGSGKEIFVSSSNFDLLRFDGEKLSELTLKQIKSRSWGWNQIDLRSRVDGDWWFPTAYGLLRFPAVKRFEDLARAAPKKIYTKADGLFADDIFRAFEDSRGDIWFSVVSPAEGTLLRWERKSEKIYGYTSSDGLPDGNAATAFAEDGAGNLWLGFYSGGAARYRNGKFQFFSSRTGFPTGLVSSIYSDRSGRIWIAISNSGVIRVDNPNEDEPRFVNLNVGNGLSSNQANCVTEDNFGRIYITTARGINRVEPETGRIKLYTQADGLPGSSVGRCARDEEGNLWFSQKFTLVKLNVQTDENLAPPPIFIGDLRVNGETIKKLSELGETSIENLDFTSEQRQIQIDFFALGFSTGETLSYQYKLEGADWSEPNAQRTVNLNLSPGSYGFLVRAVNAEGAASERPARVSFSIARPVWQRWWFLLLAALIVSGIVYALYSYRLKRLLELERVRTRIATDLHDDIGSSLSQIAILSEVVRQKVGDNGANEPLNLIAETSREMVDSMSDIVWAINPQKDHLSDLIHRMRRFAGDVLDAKDVLYRFHLSENSADISLGADIRREVYLIFKECVNNLVKYSDAGEVDLSIRIENNSLVVAVRDNGKGFDAAEKTNGKYDGFGGNGLINMRRRAENLGGKFEIESEKGVGTSVEIRIPVAGKLHQNRRKLRAEG